MQRNRKNLCKVMVVVLAMSMLAGCKTKEAQTVTVAAAASLETCMTKELIPLFEKQNPNIKIQGTYDSSGKLQAQIEAGAEVDVFFSAASGQMNTLKDKGLMDDSTIVDLLENKIVLIMPAGQPHRISKFEDIGKAEMIAIGDPESVPAGQYAKEVLENLGIWDLIQGKLSLGTNVTEVLNWVAEGNVDAGIVYATDAIQTDNVTVVAEAPEDYLKKPIYPIGMVKTSGKQDAARKFLTFLQSEEALNVLENNGFIAAK